MDLDWEGLTVAFAARSMLMNHFLDRASGEVHAHLNGSAGLREALLHERSGRFLRIPKSTADVDAARCRAFAPRMEDAGAREKALLALESAGPGAFRDVLLAFPNDEKAWFVFRARRVQEELLAWLASQGVRAEPPG
jgi:hypothetical protein